MNFFSNAAYLPPASQPPHDPKRLPLNAKTGWRIGYIENLVISHCGELSLDLKPVAKRSFAEASGAFGGLVIPKYLAYTEDCGVLLLDQKNALLKKFDPCSCQFITVPCTGGVGSGLREFNAPAAIAICGDSLLVADTGNQRLMLYSLLGFLVRGSWLPPAQATEQPWQPTAIVVGNDRKVWVADAANGYLHCFNFGGRWLKAIRGVGAVQALAVDKENRLYAAVSEALPVSIYDPATGEQIGVLSDSENLCHAFTDPGIATDAGGAFNLGKLCDAYQDNNAPQASARWFDQTGKPVPPPKLPEQKYQTGGRYLSTAIDSQLYRCQWDRIALRAMVPKGTRIKISTFSAESALTAKQIENLPEQQWQTGQWLYPEKNSRQDWDCLIRSEPGRLLWLKIDLSGDGTTTPAIANLQLDFPRISLRRYLPAVFGEDAQAADFTDRFLAVFDRGFRQIETEIDFMARLFDPLSAPADAGKQDFLSWLASWIGVTLDRQLPLATRRNLVKNAARLYQCRGTLSGLRQMLDLYLGFSRRQCATHADCGPCTTRAVYQWQAPGIILEHYKLRRWLFLDAGRLGDQARLWGQKIVNRSQLSGPQIDGNAQLGVTQLNTRQDPLRDPFHVYAHKFTVFLPAWVGRLASYNKSIGRLIQAEKPAHTAHQIVYVEPRFRVGIQSMIGFDAVIGCYPQGVTLNEAALGKATVLSNQDYAPTVMRIGNRSTIGSTTILQ